MAVTLTPTVLSGLACPYALEADLDASTLGQAGPRAGRVEVTQTTGRPALELMASGAQTATTKLSLAVQRPGNLPGASFRFLRTVSGVADSYWFGGNAYNLLTGFHPVSWDGIVNQENPHSCVLPDDTEVVVCQTDFGLGTLSVNARTYDPDTDTYSGAATVVSGLNSAHNPWPCLLTIPDPQGSVDEPILLCAYWVADSGANEAQISIKYSRDQGATWAVWATNVLTAAVTIETGSPYYVLGRIRMARCGSQLAMVAHLTASSGSEYEIVRQWKSGDLGVTFEAVGDHEGFGWCDMVTLNNTAWVAVASASIALSAITLYRLPTAGVHYKYSVAVTGLFLATPVTVCSGAPAVFSFAAFSMCATRSGQLVFVLVQPIGATRYGHSSVYDPATSTVTQLTIASATAGISRLWWWDGLATSTEYPIKLSATAWRGMIRIHCTMASSSGTYDLRLTRLDLGGPSTLTMPPLFTTGGDGQRCAWRLTCLPTVSHTVYGATMTGAGTNSVTTNVGWETFTTVANQRYATMTPVAAATAQVWQCWLVKQDSGGGVTSRVIACSIRLASAGIGFEAELRFSATQVRFRDINAGTDIATVDCDVAGGVAVFMAVSCDGEGSAWVADLDKPEARYWKPITLGTNLTDDAGAGGTVHVITFGNPATGTAVSRWVALGKAEVSGIIATADLAAGADFPTDLRGIPFAPQGAYAAANVSIGATGGPALAGDTWDVLQDAEHPVRYLAPVGDEDSLSNVVGGERTSSAEEASAWWATATTGYVVLRFPEAQNRVHPALIAIHTEGLNAASPAVVARDIDAGSYTTLGTLANTATGLRYARSGASSKTVRVDTGGATTTEIYCAANSLRGGWFNFGGGAGKQRLILGNTEGRWSNDGDAALIILTLDGIDGTEATSGTGGYIIYPRATFIAALTASTEYGKFGLYFSSAPDLAEAQIRCRVLAVAPVEPMLYARRWGTAYTTEDPSEVFEARSGLRRGRQIKTAPRRILRLPLTTLWNQAPLLAPTTQTPAVFKGYNNASHPIAGQFGDNPGKLLGTWLNAGGAQHPVLWIPRIDPTVATQTLVGDSAAFYCRITSAPEFTDQYGRDTGSVHAPVLEGSEWTLEEET